MIVLKNALVAQAQPPRDPLLVLQRETKRRLDKACASVRRRQRDRKGMAVSPRRRGRARRGKSNVSRARSVGSRVRVKGAAAVKLYLHSVVMHSICGQRLHNAHIAASEGDTQTEKG